MTMANATNEVNDNINARGLICFETLNISIETATPIQAGIITYGSNAQNIMNI